MSRQVAIYLDHYIKLMYAKRVFMCFLGIFELGSLLCGVATSSKMFIVGRAVAGMGGSGITNGALTIIALVAPMEKRPSMRRVPPTCQTSLLMLIDLKST
jgi:MFS family permease